MQFRLGTFAPAAALVAACTSPLAADDAAPATVRALRYPCESCVTIERPDVAPIDAPRASSPPPEAPARVYTTPAPARQDVRARFVAVSLGDAGQHLAVPVENDQIGYGSGAALLDVDGDLLDDLFVGAGGPRSSEACVYNNRSTPGHIAFERVESWCFDSTQALEFGFGVDVDNDGNDELLAGNGATLALIDLQDDTAIDLTPLLGGRCMVSSVLHTDLDFDGDADLLIACAIEYDGDHIGAPRAMAGLAWNAGAFEAINPAELPWGNAAVNALALGTLDVDGDGLLDFVVAADTFSSPTRVNPRLDPGGIALRCADDEACNYRVARLFDGPAAWGSYMGAAPIVVGDALLLYVTDWGANRALETTVLPAPSSVAPWHRLLPPSRTGEPLFSWSAMVEDFDLDGDDDVFLTQGKPSSTQRFSGWREHYDALLTQVDDGQFVTASEAVGLLPHAWASDSGDAPHYSSRAGVRADLDLDGRLDVVVNPFVGSLRAYTLASDPPSSRCTIRPLPSIVAGRHGFAVISTDGVRRTRLSEAHMRFGTPSSFTTAVRTGLVEFPSGARVAFDCGADDEVVVAEPIWIRVSVDGCVRLALDPAIVSPAERWSIQVDSAPSVELGGIDRFLAAGGACIDGIDRIPGALTFARDGVAVPRLFVP